MITIGWIIAILLFIVAYVGLVYPIIPSALFIIAGFLSFGLFVGFQEMTWLFWIIQILFLVLLFGADLLSNMVGVKKFGGSKAGMWGSTIGLLVGPFVIPVAGIVLGPFLGAVLAELIVKKLGIKEALRVGVGSLVGFLTSIVTKGLLMTIMIVVFIYYVA